MSKSQMVRTRVFTVKEVTLGKGQGQHGFRQIPFAPELALTDAYIPSGENTRVCRTRAAGTRALHTPTPASA